MRDGGQLDPSRWPRPDFAVALSAAPSPIGSVLRARGLRRAGSQDVDVAISRTGDYAEEPNAEAATALAAGLTRSYGSIEDVPFAYLLVGIGEASPVALDSSAASAPREENPGAGAAARVDLGAVALGTKIAAVAALELLRPAPRLGARKGGGLGWTEHHY